MCSLNLNKSFRLSLSVEGTMEGKKEGCAPGVKSGEGSEEKKLGVDCLADIPMLNHEHIFVQGSPELFCSPSSLWNLMRVPLVIFTDFIDKKQPENQIYWAVRSFWRFLVQPATRSRDSIKVSWSSNPSLLRFDSMRKPKYRQRGIISPFVLRHFAIYCRWLISSSDFKLINSFTHQCTHRHNFIYLRTEGHTCINEWTNKCDACSFILTHINTIICHSLDFFTNETQRSWDGPGSPTDQNPVDFWGGLRKTALSCHCHLSHLWLKVSNHFSTTCKTHQLWPLLLLWEGSVPNAIFLSPYLEKQDFQKNWKALSKLSTCRKGGHQDLAFSKRFLNVGHLLLDLEWFQCQPFFCLFFHYPLPFSF